MAAYKEQYYTLEENEMQDLIQKAKDGNMSAQNELLKVFNNFLTKYSTMLYYRKVQFGGLWLKKVHSSFYKRQLRKASVSKKQDEPFRFENSERSHEGNNLHGKKVWGRRRHQANCRHDILPVHREVPKKRFRKGTDTI